jgi:hypothetical protein
MPDEHMDRSEDENGESLPAYPFDGRRFERLAKNIADLLTELISATNETATRSEERRKRAFVDLRALLDEIPAPDQGVVLTRLEYEVQRTLDAQGSPKVTVSAGCVGRNGGSINATDNGVTVGACAIVEGGKVIGGGVQGGFTY